MSDLLATYLRDHAAGARAGLSLVKRCARSNEGNEFGALCAELTIEIDQDRRTLRRIMDDLGVRPSRLKLVISALAEFAARIKSNGRLVRYSPSSRVVELEGLAAGVFTKRNLWRSLQAIADIEPRLDGAELDALVERASDQLDQLLRAHRDAAAIAFRADAVRTTTAAP